MEETALAGWTVDRMARMNGSRPDEGRAEGDDEMLQAERKRIREARRSTKRRRSCATTERSVQGASSTAGSSTRLGDLRVEQDDLHDPKPVTSKRVVVIPQSEIAAEFDVRKAVRTSTSLRRTDVSEAPAVAPASVRRPTQPDPMEAELQELNRGIVWFR